jgi:hypothetical protein
LILSRISKNITAGRWSAVSLEFVIVVFGVFIGIQAANWNEARADRVRENVYISRLDADFDVIATRLRRGKEIFRSSAESIRLLITARRIHDGEQSGEMPDDAALLIAFDGMGGGMVPSGASATFEEMVSSGDLKILTNEALRNALFEYDEFSGVARDAWRSLRDSQVLSQDHLAGIVRSDFDFERDFMDTRRTVSFDKDRFLAQEDVIGHLDVIMQVQVNQYLLAAHQLELVQEIEALLSQERALRE